MSKQHSFYDTIDQIACYGISKGIFHLNTSKRPITGTRIIIDEKPLINFGSCSYLGLEFHPAIKAASKAAIEQYGSQFSASRAYISLGLYAQLEELLQKIFNAPCVITPTTTLGHIAAIPVLIENDAAVIMDQQVHNSVQTAVQLVKPNGVHVEIIRHNNMEQLEERIMELRLLHKKIWYMADGIYSMFGDACPIDTVYSFLDKYPELHLYIDDAHGMSIHGKYGRGYVLSRHDIHPKMVMATSMNKAFASGGGVLVCGDKEAARKIGNVGGPLLSSGPMQPSGLGAAIASAQIHLSEELPGLQQKLEQNIAFTTQMLKLYNLPQISEAGAAIFFVAVSYPRLGHNLVARMIKRGFFVNLGIFPTVPMRKTGVRFTVTALHTREEIQAMIKTLAEEFALAMKEENISLPSIYQGFKIAIPEASDIKPVDIASTHNLVIRQYTSIKEIDKAEWNHLFEGKGSFDWDGLKTLETVFNGNPLPKDNWVFNYLVVKDIEGKTVSATFLTTAIWKDDMLSPASVSEQVEEKRKQNPEYLTSTVLCSGSLLTEGEHFFINRNHAHWKEAVVMILDRIYLIRELHQANHIVLRDFHGIHRDLDSLMVDNGFFRVSLPDSHVVGSLSWNSPQEFYDSLSVNNRSHIRKKVLRHTARFNVEVVKVSSWLEEVEHWFSLYQNVKEKSLELNTFSLPLKLFKNLALDENWEVLQLTLHDDGLQNDSKPCCMVYSYKTGDSYIPLIIGMDYEENAEFNIYRQALYQIMLRAKKLGKSKVLLGFSAGLEKQKFGAHAQKVYAYMHSYDSYNMEQLAVYSSVSRKNTKKIKVAE
ncbi:aminotransferase class I/II-fold pyridoxal phosphate-dependent enzyme [Ferruginibacter sp.]